MTPEAGHPSVTRYLAEAGATLKEGLILEIDGQPLALRGIVIALVVAMGLGAFHALEPRHDKTVVAAYLVGARGTAQHALWLGLIVTATHTAGVYLLGAMTLVASAYIVPEQLYPWLSAVSGLMITGLGIYLFLQRYAGINSTYTPSHDHVYGYSHGRSHAHTHAHEPVFVHAHAWSVHQLNDDRLSVLLVFLASGHLSIDPESWPRAGEEGRHGQS